MIKVTIVQLSQGIEAIRSLMELDIDFGMSYRLYQLSVKLDEALNYAKEYFASHQSKDDINAFVSEEIEIDVEPIKKEDLINSIDKKCKFKPIYFASMDFIFEKDG